MGSRVQSIAIAGYGSQLALPLRRVCIYVLCVHVLLCDCAVAASRCSRCSCLELFLPLTRPKRAGYCHTVSFMHQMTQQPQIMRGKQSHCLEQKGKTYRLLLRQITRSTKHHDGGVGLQLHHAGTRLAWLNALGARTALGKLPNRQSSLS